MAAIPNKEYSKYSIHNYITGSIIEKIVCDQNPYTAAGKCLIGYPV